ncbi:MAG TPA: hypothetical protein VIY51_09175 [Xanthobacteraceae bacterium]
MSMTPNQDPSSLSASPADLFAIRQIVVPADLVARSHPAGHSVPLVCTKRKFKRAHPYRILALALLVSLVALMGLTVAVDHALEAGRDAGYHLVCTADGSGARAHLACHWEKS